MKTYWLLQNGCYENILKVIMKTYSIALKYLHNNKYSWTLRHSITAIDHVSLDGAV